MWAVWRVVYTVTAIIVVFLLAWYIDLVRRPVVNEEGLQEGLRHRTRISLLASRSGEGPPGATGRSARHLWPLSTNLLSTVVAGPGITLFFHYHLFVIILASVGVISWVVFALVVNKDLLVLGFRSFNGSRELCAIVRWGYELRRNTMVYQVGFGICLYIGTFVACIVHAVLQKRRYVQIDNDTTMKDFAALLSGLPEDLDLKDRVEESLSKTIEGATGEPVVGVSLCCDYSSADWLTEHLTGKLHEKEVDAMASGPTPAAPPAETTDSQTEPRGPGVMRRTFDGVNNSLEMIMGVSSEKEKEAARLKMINELKQTKKSGQRRLGGSSQPDMKEGQLLEDMCKDITCVGKAYVVFKTEASRDAALTAVSRSDGLQVDGMGTLQLTLAEGEPDAIRWYARGAPAQVRWEMCKGALTVFLGLTFWITAFYYPSAQFLLSYSYAEGQKPSRVKSLLFTILVVLGNQSMYLLCRTMAEKVNFRFQTSVEVFWIVLYAWACSLQVLLDAVVLYFATNSKLEHTQVGNFEGRRVSDLHFMQNFESYPMQKMLGTMLFKYAFPATFLIPFIMEPIFAIFLPKHLLALVVRSDASIRGNAARIALTHFTPMDMSRYADILLNFGILSMVMWVPAGYILPMFGTLTLCHIYIYVYDHYRILRCVPSFDMSDSFVDTSVNYLMACPVAILGSGVVYKMHYIPGFEQFRGWTLLMAIVGTFFGHILIHVSLLYYVVPMSGNTGHERSRLSFLQISTMVPASWFTANPVHCLRSEIIYKHNPPCPHYIKGKEHLMRANPAIGVHFEDAAADVDT